MKTPFQKYRLQTSYYPWVNEKLDKIRLYWVDIDRHREGLNS
jgi:hypothetical protein